MKPLLIIAITLFISTTLLSQDPELEYYKSKEMKTLLGRNKSGGGYFAVQMGYASISGRHAVTTGARMTWIANHVLGIGFGGNGFINEVVYNPALNSDVFVAGGYGGLYIEPVLMPRSPIHFSFPVLFGAGGISYISDNYPGGSNFIEETETFLIIEPAAEIQLNMTRFFRLSIGASYRYPSSFNTGLGNSEYVSVSSLRGPGYSVTLKFGKF